MAENSRGCKAHTRLHILCYHLRMTQRLHAINFGLVSRLQRQVKPMIDADRGKFLEEQTFIAHAAAMKGDFKTTYAIVSVEKQSASPQS